MLRRFSAQNFPVSVKSLQVLAFKEFSVAFNVRQNFETAWKKHREKTPSGKGPEQTSSEQYQSSYYKKNINKLKQGYIHPYHSEKYPVVFSHMYYMKTLLDAVGPEQVSPHYESLSRSRRGLIIFFFYVAFMNSIARLGGWNHNEWYRGMLFHQEYLISFFLAYVEIRHFTFFLGPKFTNFYNTYTRYEIQQLCTQWSDLVEEHQSVHLQNSKEQMEYMRIHNEFEFIKARSIKNFLTNERHSVERHFHDRAVAMLQNIQKFESENLRNQLKSITTEALKTTLDKIKDPKETKNIQKRAFEAALEGITSGEMKYQSDPILPLLKEELTKRTTALKNLSHEDESKLLTLTNEQKRIIAELDRKTKVEYITQSPKVHSPGVKAHDKYKEFTDLITKLASTQKSA